MSGHGSPSCWRTTGIADAVGQPVEARQPVIEPTLEMRLAGRIVAVHRPAAPGTEPRWLPEHRAAEAIALGRHGRHLRAVHDDNQAEVMAVRLELGDGDYDVEPPDLNLFGLDRPAPR
jgi:hypothetical protein